MSLYIFILYLILYLETTGGRNRIFILFFYVSIYLLLLLLFNFFFSFFVAQLNACKLTFGQVESTVQSFLDTNERFIFSKKFPFYSFIF